MIPQNRLFRKVRRDKNKRNRMNDPIPLWYSVGYSLSVATPCITKKWNMLSSK